MLSLADEIGELRRDALPVVADVSVDEDVNLRRLYEQALSRFERASTFWSTTWAWASSVRWRLTAEDYDWMMNSNMRSSFLCAYFLPRMLERQEAGSCSSARSRG
ncbi:MAG: hypothetical protein U0703_23130 [Anaerolineae bacterium]